MKRLLFSLCILFSICNGLLPVTWSNRNGQVLTRINDWVWAAERPFVWNTIDVGGRSAICKLADGNWFIHSPVNGSDDLVDAIDKLGGLVTVIVAPNFEHLKYTPQWHSLFPNAVVLGCPGLAKLKPSYPVQGEVSGAGHPIIDDSFDTLFFDCEVNPFNSKPFFNEVIFFHKKSKTLLCTDIYWNYPSGRIPSFGVPGDPVSTSLGTKLWKFGMDKVYWPFYQKYMVGLEGERRTKYNAAVSKLLSWEIETIVPCHGDIVVGKELSAKALKMHFINRIAGR